MKEDEYDFLFEGRSQYTLDHWMKDAPHIDLPEHPRVYNIQQMRQFRFIKESVYQEIVDSIKDATKKEVKIRLNIKATRFQRYLNDTNNPKHKNEIIKHEIEAYTKKCQNCPSPLYNEIRTPLKIIWPMYGNIYCTIQDNFFNNRLDKTYIGSDYADEYLEAYVDLKYLEWLEDNCFENKMSSEVRITNDTEVDNTELVYTKPHFIKEKDLNKFMEAEKYLAEEGTIIRGKWNKTQTEFIAYCIK